MQDNNFQNDLFGKGGSQGKSPRMPIFDGYVKQQRHLPYFKMPTEYAVIAAIVILVFLTLSYAWGVKVGRASLPTVEVSTVESVEVPATPALETDPEESQTGSEVDLKSYVDYAETEMVPDEELNDPLPESVIALPEEIETPPEQQAVSTGRYVIYLAALKKEPAAEGMSQALKDLGVDARVSKKSDWYQVYAAGYSTISEAKAAKTVLLEDYPDCYIRRVE